MIIDFDIASKTSAELELAILERLVKDAVASGYTVSVYDGGNLAVGNSRIVENIIKSLQSTDGDTLVFKKAGRRIGSVDRIYGNSPWEVIFDHTDTEEMADLLRGAERIAEQIENHLA